MQETNGAAKPAAPSARIEAEELVQQALDLRSRLQAERNELVTELDRIDAILARLPAEDPASTAKPKTASKQRGAHVQGHKGSIPDLILGIIQASPGIGSAMIIPAAQKERKTLLPRDVYANLNRLKKRGLVATKGKRGAQRYFALERKEATA